MKSVCVLPGDGIGPEVIGCARRVVEAVTDGVEFVDADIGLSAFGRTGGYISDDTLESMKDSDSCLFGAVTSQASRDYRSPVLTFRKELDLFANLRPVRDIAGVCDRRFDVVIVRENSEGLYTMHEEADNEGVTTHRRVSRKASERIIGFAINAARSMRRSNLCCVHKANVLRLSDGLFLNTFKEIMSTDAQDLRPWDQLVDSAAAKLVLCPEEFDVIVTLNMYGDILSDVASAAVGGLGFAPSGNIGDRFSVFEPSHGSAPDIAGKGVANPTAAILAASMMLKHIGMGEESTAVVEAVERTFRSGERTIDIGGSSGSTKFTDAVVSHVSRGE